MMGFLICFILSLTNGPIEGWGSAAFIAPFGISFVTAISFFIWEARIPVRTAVLPSSVFQIKNFVTSSLVIMVPLGFWFTSQLIYANHFQLAFGWTPRESDASVQCPCIVANFTVHAAAALIPQGIMGLVIGVLSQFVPQIVGKPQFSVPFGVVRE